MQRNHGDRDSENGNQVQEHTAADRSDTFDGFLPEQECQSGRTDAEIDGREECAGFDVRNAAG